MERCYALFMITEYAVEVHAYEIVFCDFLKYLTLRKVSFCGSTNTKISVTGQL